jgi:Na+/H+ antiporter NhaD/arsenite permease-like protein
MVVKMWSFVVFWVVALCSFYVSSQPEDHRRCVYCHVNLKSWIFFCSLYVCINCGVGLNEGIKE